MTTGRVLCHFVALFFVSLFFVGTLLFPGSSARGATRPVFMPGDSRAFILMQGVSAGAPVDYDPRRLFDAMTLPPTDVQGGGKGKGIKTADGVFTLSCVARESLPENVMCTLVVKPSSRSRVSSRDQLAEVSITDEEALLIYQDLAGAGSTQTWTFESEDRWLQIESKPEQFHLRFQVTR